MEPPRDGAQGVEGPVGPDDHASRSVPRAARRPRPRRDPWPSPARRAPGAAVAAAPSCERPLEPVTLRHHRSRRSAPGRARLQTSWRYRRRAAARCSSASARGRPEVPCRIDLRRRHPGVVLVGSSHRDQLPSVTAPPAPPGGAATYGVPSCVTNSGAPTAKARRRSGSTDSRGERRRDGSIAGERREAVRDRPDDRQRLASDEDHPDQSHATAGQRNRPRGRTA